MRIARLWLPAVSVVACLVASALGASPLELVNGEPATIEGSTRFTFWIKEPLPTLRAFMYKKLPAGTEQRLLAGAVVEVPPGIELVRTRLGVTSETASEQQGSKKYSYQQYVIGGEWKLTAAQDRAPGPATIRIRFPAVLEARDSLGADSPREPPVITLAFVTFASAQERAGTSAASHLQDSLLVVGLVLLALGGAMAALVRLFTGGDSRLFFVAAALLWGTWYLTQELTPELGLALHYAWTTGPLPGLGATLAFNALVLGAVWLLAGLGRWTPAREKGLWGGSAVIVAFLAAHWIRAARPVPQAHVLHVAAALFPALIVSVAAARLRVTRPPDGS